ncbi:hypothetical protein LCGC14_1908180 [marine sediment metagenome]|uniref:Uncharacterized protein n=1 Tax=marine sediment metagenome TaxID=412755 RepID=A0A0F9FUG3_9ZZZZ
MDNGSIDYINALEHEMGNMFEAAKKTEIATPKAKGKAKPQIVVEDLRQYAALKAAMKTIETMVETLKESVNDVALDAFLIARRSDSIQGTDGDTTASLQLRKRTSRSVLGEQEVKVLDHLKIAFEKSSDSKFYINSKYSEDSELLGKVSDALEGIVPDDFLGHTGEKFVTTSTSIADAMSIEDIDTRRDVLKIVSTQAARTKFGGTHDEMLKILDKVLKGDS